MPQDTETVTAEQVSAALAAYDEALQALVHECTSYTEVLPIDVRRALSVVRKAREQRDRHVAAWNSEGKQEIAT